MKTLLKRSVLSLAAVMLVATAAAQPTRGDAEVVARNSAEPVTQDGGWSTSVGAGAIWGPAFSGSSDYQMMLVPDIRLAYGDTFFASVGQGIGYNFEVDSEWVVGPLVKFDFGRKADGESTFRVAGDASMALRGFQDIDSTILLGGFAKFDRDMWSAKVELLKGMSSHEGMIADFSIDYKARFGGSEAQPGPPVFIATGPRMRWANDDYTNTYYGINAADSLGSGLPTYTAGGGIASIGWSASIVMPLSRKLALVGFAGYDKIMGDAADSPLIVQRGSENQFSAGAVLSYRF